MYDIEFGVDKKGESEKMKVKYYGKEVDLNIDYVIELDDLLKILEKEFNRRLPNWSTGYHDVERFYEE